MPVDLHKQDNDDVSSLIDWDGWVETHLTQILIVLTIFLFLFVLAVIVVLFNMAVTPTATEANTYYYALERIV